MSLPGLATTRRAPRDFPAHHSWKSAASELHRSCRIDEPAHTPTAIVHGAQNPTVVLGRRSQPCPGGCRDTHLAPTFLLRAPQIHPHHVAQLDLRIRVPPVGEGPTQKPGPGNHGLYAFAPAPAKLGSPRSSHPRKPRLPWTARGCGATRTLPQRLPQRPTPNPRMVAETRPKTTPGGPGSPLAATRRTADGARASSRLPCDFPNSTPPRKRWPRRTIRQRCLLTRLGGQVSGRSDETQHALGWQRMFPRNGHSTCERPTTRGAVWDAAPSFGHPGGYRSLRQCRSLSDAGQADA